MADRVVPRARRAAQVRAPPARSGRAAARRRAPRHGLRAQHKNQSSGTSSAGSCAIPARCGRSSSCPTSRGVHAPRRSCRTSAWSRACCSRPATCSTGSAKRSVAARRPAVRDLRPAGVPAHRRGHHGDPARDQPPHAVSPEFFWMTRGAFNRDAPAGRRRRRPVDMAIDDRVGSYPRALQAPARHAGVAAPPGQLAVHRARRGARAQGGRTRP